MISMIASVGRNMELGKNNNLIWHIPRDMKFFKETTMDHSVLMGWNTYKSLPGMLHGRDMIVLSLHHTDSNVKIVSSIEQIVDEFSDNSKELFIIGGAKVYNEFFPYSSKLYLTEIDDTSDDADSFFPEFDKSLWNIEELYSNQYKNLNYKIRKYVRKVK